MEILHTENLTFSYPNSQEKTLQNINFSLHYGDFCLIFGDTGCGKTTFLQLLKKEIAPYGNINGKIYFEGEELENCNNKSSEIGFVMQNPDSQIVTDTVWHEMCFGLQNMGLDDETIKRRVAETASYFGIEKYFHKKIYELSNGQKQLLNLASVMVMQPKLLILDEPTSQLDPIVATDFLNTIKKLNYDLGLTIIITEHRLCEVFQMCNKVSLMENGNFVFSGEPYKIEEFYKNNKDHYSFDGLPVAMRIYASLNGKGKMPITIRDGRKYLRENFQNKIKELPKKEYVHSETIALEIKNLYFRYKKDEKDVLKGLNLKVFKGEHLCILGGNGVGKSTLLNNISGLLKCYNGKILIDGKNIKSFKGNTLYKDNLSLLPQNPQSLFIENTVDDELYNAGKILGYSKENLDKKIEDLKNLLNISALSRRHPFDLSGGEQQKVALAKILLNNPKILLLDEPTKGIDSKGKKALANIIKDLKSNNITVVTVTHDTEFSAEYGDRCCMLFDGQIVSIEEPEEFFSNNNFYTTGASKISRDFYNRAVKCSDVVTLCQMNRSCSCE